MENIMTSSTIKDLYSGYKNKETQQSTLSTLSTL